MRGSADETYVGRMSSLTVCAGDLCGRLGVDEKSIEIQERPKPEI